MTHFLNFYLNFLVFPFKDLELSEFSYRTVTCPASQELPLNLECRALELSLTTRDSLTEKNKKFNVPLKMLDDLIAELNAANDIMNNV